MLYSDMYFETSNDYVSIDEMLEGDIKYSLELGLELKDNFTTGLAASGGGLGPCSDDSLDLSVDLVAVDPCGPGLMVNPKSVIPAKPYYNYHVQVKRELKAETESDFCIKPKLEPQDPEDEDFEDDITDSDEDAEEIEDVKPSSVWSSIQKTEDIRNVKVLMEPNDLQDSKLSMGMPFATLVKNRRPQLKMEPTLIKVKSMDAIVNKHIDYLPLNNKNKSKLQQDPKNALGDCKFKYPKPAFSYSCLIAMALKNSRTGSLPVSEIYNFMCLHFPYFKSAPSGWKNSVRHNLSLNKCFEKIEKHLGASNASCRKGCLWAMNPAKITKMDDEVAKWSKKDPQGIRRSMRYPENLEKLEKGQFVSHDMDWCDDNMIKVESVTFPQEIDEDGEISNDDDDGENVEENAANESEEEEEEEDDRVISTNSDTEDEGEVPPSLKPFDSRLADSASDIGIDLSDEMKEELGFLEEVVSNEEAYHLPKRQRLIMSTSNLRRPVGTA